jgi:hypothetical protein
LTAQHISNEFVFKDRRESLRDIARKRYRGLWDAANESARLDGFDFTSTAEVWMPEFGIQVAEWWRHDMDEARSIVRDDMQAGEHFA